MRCEELKSWSDGFQIISCWHCWVVSFLFSQHDPLLTQHWVINPLNNCWLFISAPPPQLPFLSLFLSSISIHVCSFLLSLSSLHPLTSHLMFIVTQHLLPPLALNLLCSIPVILFPDQSPAHTGT